MAYTRGEPVVAFPIEGEASLEMIASGRGCGHVELEEVSTELCWRRDLNRDDVFVT